MLYKLVYVLYRLVYTLKHSIDKLYYSIYSELQYILQFKVYMAT